uniref:Tetraspanin n=1 Tax=Ditylenchus dipsaci TaxID=166011 RepID=A0A915CNM4_9BILA
MLNNNKSTMKHLLNSRCVECLAEPATLPLNPIIEHINEEGKHGKIISNIKHKALQRNSSAGSNDRTLLKHNGKLPKITMTADADLEVNNQMEKNNISNNNAASTSLGYVQTTQTISKGGNVQTNTVHTNRKQSTGTLNRLILVAQALESEVDSRHRNDVNGTRIVCTIRMANMVLLILVNLLILTGVGQYHGRTGVRQSLLLTMDKWYFRRYLAAALSALMLFATFILQLVHCCRIQHSKLMCICYSFGCVPFSLFVFGMEMHYSACPWLDDFYRTEVLKKDFQSVEKYFDTQCGINGWALAGIFSLLSCVIKAEISQDGLSPCRIPAAGAWISANRDVLPASGFGCCKVRDATSGFEARSGLGGRSTTCLSVVKEVDLVKNANEEQGIDCVAYKNLCDLCPCVCLSEVSVLDKGPVYDCVEGVTIEGESQSHFTIQ